MGFRTLFVLTSGPLFALTACVGGKLSGINDDKGSELRAVSHVTRVDKPEEPSSSLCQLSQQVRPLLVSGQLKAMQRCSLFLRQSLWSASPCLVLPLSSEILSATRKAGCCEHTLQPQSACNRVKARCNLTLFNCRIAMFHESRRLSLDWSVGEGVARVGGTSTFSRQKILR